MGYQVKKILIISVFLPFLSSCGGGAAGGPGNLAPDFNSSGDSFDPNAGNPTDPDKEECQPAESIAVTPSVIEFGLNQIHTTDSPTEECQSISISGCQEFEAEIDRSSDLPGNPQFVLRVGANDAVGRVRATGSVLVCYKRSHVSYPQEHRGRVNVVVAGGRFASSIPLTGTTIQEVFTINAPRANPPLIVWEDVNGAPTPADDTKPYESYFEIPASGSYNLAQAESLLRRNDEGLYPLNISVKPEGRTVTTTLDPNGNFSAPLEIPSVAPNDPYKVHFSVRTKTKGTLTKIVPVIRYTAPKVRISIRDNQGNEVKEIADDPAENGPDSYYRGRQLTVGVFIDNLAVSGPNAAHRVTLHMKRSDLDNAAGSEMLPRGGVSMEFKPFDPEAGHPACFDKFQKTTDDLSRLHCITVNSKDLAKGLNVFTARACNRYTDWAHRQNPSFKECEEDEARLLIVNDKPVIQITRPAEKTRYELNRSTVTVEGTVENFVMEETVLENGQPVTKCLVELWANASIGENGNKAGIPLCDSLKRNIIRNADANLERGNFNNIRKAAFSVDLTEAGVGGDHKLTLYTNLIRVKAQNKSGHVSVLVRSFERGKRNNSLPITGNRELTAGAMGENHRADGTTRRSPVMLQLSEGALNDVDIITVIRKALNDNLLFRDLAMGGGLTKDDNDQVEPIGTGSITTASMDRINEMLHGTAPEQVRALLDYQTRQGGNTRTYFDQSQAKDACNNPITTAIITPNVFQYIFPWISPQSFGRHLNTWPSASSGICRLPNGQLDPNCDTTEQGNWDIEVDLKNDGFVDAVLTLDGKTVNGRKLPAFWGHFVAFNLVEEGTTGAYQTRAFTELPVIGPLIGGTGIADPGIPVLMNVGKMELRLTDMARIMKVQTEQVGNETRVKMCNLPNSQEQEPCACQGSNCTNMLYIYQDRVKASPEFISFEPYEGCYDYFHEKFPNASAPFGCNPTDNTYAPFLIDTNSPQGYLLYSNASAQGELNTLLTLTRDVFEFTFKNIVSCAGTQLVNPILDSSVFPYPSWVPESDRINSLKAAVGKENGEITVKFGDEAENFGEFALTPRLKEADLLIRDGKLQLKLPMELSALGVEGTDPGYHLFREPNAGFDQPFLPYSELEKPFLGASLNIEEIVNAASHVLMRKGVRPLLELFDVEELTTDLPEGYSPDAWTIGLDEVIFSRFDICNIGGGLLKTSLPTSLIMANAQDLFDERSPDRASHWDIIIDKNQPPTLALLDGAENDGSRILQVGLRNVHISLTDFLSFQDGEGEDAETFYYLGNREVLRLRLDALLRLKVKYVPAESGRLAGRLQISILPLEQQALYLSVLNGNTIFDDSQIINDPYTSLIKNAFNQLAVKDLAGFELEIPASLKEFDDFTTVRKDEAASAPGYGLVLMNNTDIAPNGTCENGELKYRRPPNLSLIDRARRGLYDRFEETIRDIARVIGRLPSPLPARDASGPAMNTGRWGNVQLDPSERVPFSRTDGPSVQVTTNHRLQTQSLDLDLIDLGILDASFGFNEAGQAYPDIQLDWQNGYIHVSSQVLLRVDPRVFTELGIE